MLVTDGAPLPYQEIFEKYNSPHRPVRMFTYLIGREIADQHNLIAMSRDNKGAMSYLIALLHVFIPDCFYFIVYDRVFCPCHDYGGGT